MAKKLIFVIIF